MPLPLDIADDSDLFDWLEQVTVRSIDPDAPSASATLATASNVSALRRAVKRETTAVGKGGSVPVRSLHWSLKAADISFVPKRLDTITDAVGVAWRIESVDVATFGTRYSCETIRIGG